MNIGVDLRPLQTGHKYRGIGEVTKQTTNRIVELASKDAKRDISFIFYEYEGDDPKELLTIPKELSYKVVKLGLEPENSPDSSMSDKVNRNASLLYGHPIAHSNESDVFLQFDYALGVPKNTKTILVKHDLIPYLFWDKYFESAWVPFKNRAARTTLRTLFANYKFMRLLTRSIKDAHMIISVSESTKKDLEAYFHVKPAKVKVAHLGVDIKPAKTNDNSAHVEMPTKPYLLFVGAGDARRRVEDAVAVFNNLKASGRDIQLVLVGENFKAPEMIPNPTVRSAVMGSSYKKDILTLGYIDDATKQKLFREAVAFVYPTSYEGFGIPILEAMLLGCPIVTYKNSSTGEVGGEYAYYAKNWSDMKARVEEILNLDETESIKRKQAAREYAETFTWDKTSRVIYDELLRLG